jgi:EamA domain-containing membrane protein RarD
MRVSGSTLSGFDGFLLIQYFWSGSPIQTLEFLGPEILPVPVAVVGLLSQLDRGRGGLVVGLACSVIGCVALFAFVGFVAWEHLDIHFDFGFYIATVGLLMSAVSSGARLLRQQRLVLR